MHSKLCVSRCSHQLHPTSSHRRHAGALRALPDLDVHLSDMEGHGSKRTAEVDVEVPGVPSEAIDVAELEAREEAMLRAGTSAIYGIPRHEWLRLAVSPIPFQHRQLLATVFLGSTGAGTEARMSRGGRCERRRRW